MAYNGSALFVVFEFKNIQMEQKTTNEMWTRIINDARFYDGSPKMLMQLIIHFEAQGYVLSQKCEQCTCSTLWELLVQMQKENYEAIGCDNNTDLQNTIAENRFISLTHVLQMINERQPFYKK